jgi:hypothetical protein
MKRMIKVLIVAVLMAVILLASVSPALAARKPGVLLSSPQPCHAIAKDTLGGDLVLNPPGRAPGCWFLLPPGATNNTPVTIDSGGVVI